MLSKHFFFALGILYHSCVWQLREKRITPFLLFYFSASGLFVASKHPIEEAQFVEYELMQKKNLYLKGINYGILSVKVGLGFQGYLLPYLSAPLRIIYKVKQSKKGAPCCQIQHFRGDTSFLFVV